MLTPAPTRRLYVDGNVLTLDPLRPRARSVLTWGNRIEKVFGKNPARGDVPADVERIHLGGRTVLPGFTDSHIHFSWFARALSRINLCSARSKGEALEILRQRTQRLATGEWIIGFGWSMNNWTDPAYPTAADLDPMFPDNPVALNSKCGHVLWVNTCALKVAEITGERTVAGGEIVLDPQTRRPVGILKESATSLVEDRIPKPSPEQLKHMILEAFPIAHKYGLTSVHVPEEPDSFSVFEEMRVEGNLDLRVLFFFPASQLDDLIRLNLHSGFGDEWLRIGGVKHFVDGSLGGRTAWLFEPYCGEPDNCGIPTSSRGELLDVIRKANTHRLSVAIHAIGDRAVALTLEAMQEVRGIPTLRDTVRNRIEHFQLVRPADLARLGRSVLRPYYASMQPVHLCYDRPGAETFWGARSRYAYAFRTIQEAGATLIFGSDAPVESPAPLLGVYAALTRKDLNGEPAEGWYPEEKLPLEDILRAYTVNPALASGEGHIKGMLREGYLADFVVLSDDPFHVPPEATKDITVEATVLDGDIVHRTF